MRMAVTISRVRRTEKSLLLYTYDEERFLIFEEG